MQFTTLAAGVAVLFAAAASAAPSTGTSSGAPPCATFQLKAEALPGQPKQWDGYLVDSYHTGAGLNNLQLLKNQGFDAYLNQSQIMADLNPADSQIYTWSNPTDNNYAGWGASQFNIGYGGDYQYSAFSFNASGLQWTDEPSMPAENGFAGWLACQWFLGVPQVFWLINGYNDEIPCSCAKINLLPVC